jgi:hypothetical protein
MAIDDSDIRRLAELTSCVEATKACSEDNDLGLALSSEFQTSINPFLVVKALFY